jgi:hypothetical protein
MRRLLCTIGALLVATAAAAQTSTITAPSSPFRPPVLVFPASAVNGAGTVTTACFTFPLGSTVCENASGKVGVTGTTPMLQLGGTTASFPAWKQSGTAILARLADDSGGANVGINNLQIGNILLIGGATPTISSGFGTSPSIANNNGTAAFTINVGTGGTATSGVIGLPTATTGWNCQATDITTNSATVFITKQTASTTTTATIGNFNTSAAAAAWAASDILRVSCFAF